MALKGSGLNCSGFSGLRMVWDFPDSRAYYYGLSGSGCRVEDDTTVGAR